MLFDLFLLRLILPAGQASCRYECRQRSEDEPPCLESPGKIEHSHSIHLPKQRFRNMRRSLCGIPMQRGMGIPRVVRTLTKGIPCPAKMEKNIVPETKPREGHLQ
jgi:hypothetical protein